MNEKDELMLQWPPLHPGALVVGRCALDRTGFTLEQVKRRDFRHMPLPAQIEDPQDDLPVWQVPTAEDEPSSAN